MLTAGVLQETGFILINRMDTHQKQLHSTLPCKLMANLFSSGAPHNHFFPVLQRFYLSGLPTATLCYKASSKVNLNDDTYQWNCIESSSLVPVLFKEVYSHPYISFFHLPVNGFSVIVYTYIESTFPLTSFTFSLYRILIKKHSKCCPV